MTQNQMCELCFTGDDVDRKPAIDGLWEFTCTRTDLHPDPYVWLATNTPAGASGSVVRPLDPYYSPLLTCLRPGEPWLEYAVVEWRFRTKAPSLFEDLVKTDGHLVLNPRTTQGHTASSYLVHALGRLAARDEVVRVFDDATGPWKKQAKVSYWALPPAPAFTKKLSWAGYAELNGLHADDISNVPDGAADGVA